MSKSRGRSRSKPGKPPPNQRRGRSSLGEALHQVNQRAHDHAARANRRSGRRELKSVRAAIAASAPCDDDLAPDLGRRLLRWLLALVLLPLCWVTTWTLLSRFSHATLEQGFWQTAEFWYFAVGVIVMIGWFFSGLGHAFFLYAYVLGHELTHALFVVICRGRISDFHVSREGGYVVTDKTNLVIALSPYFVPFWSLLVALAYGAARLVWDLSPAWDLAFFATIGVTWTFHLVWTLWMLPRDQPDLRENGTFLSLVVIYLANLLVLVGLLCAAEDQPLETAREFAREWLRHAAVAGDVAWRWSLAAIRELRSTAGLP